jgi:hydrogenase maturation protease
LSEPIRIIAWGNRGRRDDGVGLLLAERLETRWANRQDISVQQYHQLGPELVADLEAARLVIFVDAHVRDESPEVFFEPVQAIAGAGLDTHHCRPGELLALAAAIGMSTPPCYQLGIHAHDMDFGDSLTEPTRAAMLDAEQTAISFVESFLSEHRSGEVTNHA